MKRVLQSLTLLLLTAVLQQCSYSQSNTTKKISMDTTKKNPVYSRTDSSKVNMTDEEWRKVLPADVYNIAREKGTERPWTSKYEHSHEV